MFLRRIGELVQRQELLGKLVGHAVGDHRHADAGKQSGQAAVLAGGNAIEQVLGRHLAHASQEPDSSFIVESVKVGQRFDEVGIDELLDKLFAKPVDVHRLAASELQKLALELPAALPARRGAEVRRAVGFLLGRRRRTRDTSSASETCAPPRCGPRSSTRTTWGMISPAFSTTTMSPMRMSLRFDLVGVVQAGLADRRAGQPHGRIEMADGRELAGPADLDFDASQSRQRLLGGELVGPRPARELAGVAEPFALREIVDLDDHAVRVVGQVVPLRRPGFNVGDHLVDVLRSVCVCGLTGKPSCLSVSSACRCDDMRQSLDALRARRRTAAACARTTAWDRAA